LATHKPITPADFRTRIQRRVTTDPALDAQIDDLTRRMTKTLSHQDADLLIDLTRRRSDEPIVTTSSAAPFNHREMLTQTERSMTEHRAASPWMADRYRARLHTSEFAPRGTFFWTGRVAGWFGSGDPNGTVVCHPDTLLDAREAFRPFNLTDDLLVRFVVYQLEHGDDPKPSPIKNLFVNTEIS